MRTKRVRVIPKCTPPVKPLRPEWSKGNTESADEPKAGSVSSHPHRFCAWCWFPKNTSVHLATLHNGCPITVDPLAEAQWKSFAAYQKPCWLSCECLVNLESYFKKGQSWLKASGTHFMAVASCYCMSGFGFVLPEIWILNHWIALVHVPTW